jgi:hypothetical protein
MVLIEMLFEIVRCFHATRGRAVLPALQIRFTHHIVPLSTPILMYDAYHSRTTGNVTAVQDYLGHDFPVNSRDSKGNTGMIIASGRGQVAVIQLLLQHGANPEDSTLIGIFEGKTALMWASSQGRLDAVALLVRVGVDPHRVSDKGVFAGKNALMWAASQGKTKVVSYLLSVGVDVEYTSSAGNFQGKTALMWASSQGREDTVRVLLEAGCHVNAVDTVRTTAAALLYEVSIVHLVCDML